jgi:hypothetical protein
MYLEFDGGDDSDSSDDRDSNSDNKSYKSVDSKNYKSMITNTLPMNVLNISLCSKSIRAPSHLPRHGYVTVTMTETVGWCMISIAGTVYVLFGVFPDDVSVCVSAQIT